MSKTIDENLVMASEWSHMVDVDTIIDGKMRLSISPNEDETAALLKRLDVQGVGKLTVDLTLKRQNQIVHVRGQISAHVTQRCVITLDPVQVHVEDGFEAWFADTDSTIPIAKKRREREVGKGRTDLPMLEEHEDPEPIVDGQIDLGELAVQYLSLALDPYVHGEGAEYEHGDDTPQTEDSSLRENPFAALKDWKDKLK